MRNATLFSCAFAIATLAAAGMAHATGSAMTTAPKADLARAQQARAQVQAHVGQSKTAALKAGVAGAKPSGHQPAEFFANPHRAYPPSCLNSPMQFGMWHDDPNAKVATVNLIGDPYAGGSEATYVEPVTVYVFRVSCAGGLSATLMEFDRSSANEGNTSLYPTLPAVSVPLGGSNFYVRFADDPNTFFSTSYALNPLISSDVFVLENFYTGSTQLDYNQAFTLTLDNLNTADPNRFTDFNLGAYNPAQYPQAAH